MNLSYNLTLFVVDCKETLDMGRCRNEVQQGAQVDGLIGFSHGMLDVLSSRSIRATAKVWESHNSG